jgi:hypothetical protein
MHDPSTQAFCLVSPFKQRCGNSHYRSPLVTIWHRDPETDGSDDSCGYTYARLTEAEREKVRRVAADLTDDKYERLFWSTPDGHFCAEHPYLEMILAGFEAVAWRVFRKRIEPRHYPRIISAAVYPHDNLRSLLNGPMRKNDVERFFFIIARNFKTYDRRWYQRPRWHFWHWRIQFHVLSGQQVGTLRHALMIPGSHRWNGWVRSATAWLG